MKLFTELNEDISYLTEAKEDGEKEHFIEGVFLQANIKNRNGRIYPMDVMEGEVHRYINEVVNKNRAYGELGHPQGPQINLDRVAIIIKELKKDGSNFIGKAKLTETPMGSIAKGILKSGGVLGVSSRGLGTLKPTKEGVMEVQNDFRLATAADIVADPSAPDAYVKGIMENVDWVYDPVRDTFIEQRLEDTKKSIHKMSRSQLEEQKLVIFNRYMNALSKLS